MSPQERNALVSLLCNLLVNGYVIWQWRALAAAGALDGPDALMVWARMILWAMAGAVVLTVVLTVLISIAAGIVTRERVSPVLADERDEMFGIRAMGMTMFIAVVGFIGAIVALAAGWSALSAFLIIYFAFALGSLAGDLVKLASYRAGG